MNFVGIGMTNWNLIILKLTENILKKKLFPDFFTKDLSGDASKLIKTRNMLGKQPNILHFEFTTLNKFPSNLLGQLQVLCD